MSVVIVDLGGDTIKASKLFLHSKASSADEDSASVQLMENYVGSLSSSSSSVGVANGGTGGVSRVLMGKELVEYQTRQRASKTLRLTRPIERGFCVNWNIESDIWSYLFSKKQLNVKNLLHESTLVCTWPLYAPSALQETMDQVVFEEFSFESFVRANAAWMASLNGAESWHKTTTTAYESEQPQPTSTIKRTPRTPRTPTTRLKRQSPACQLVVDSGFSFTHVVPIWDGRVLAKGVKRVNVGGKLLTNYLKEIISFRQYNVMDDTLMINELKESLCYCSMDFGSELKQLYQNKSQRKQWVLPDFVTSFKGTVRIPSGSSNNQSVNDSKLFVQQDDDEQVLDMGLEMISVPEVLFHPSDIGLDQAGIAEAIVQAVAACPTEIQPSLYQNILLVGGNTKFHNFDKRLHLDLRPMVSSDFDLMLHTSADPILTAWQGCRKLVQSDLFEQMKVSKKEYDEHGSSICRKRFNLFAQEEDGVHGRSLR